MPSKEETQIGAGQDAYRKKQKPEDCKLEGAARDHWMISYGAEMGAQVLIAKARRLSAN